MLYWSAVLFAVAFVAALVGFGGVAATAAGISKVFFIVFLLAAGVALVAGLVTRNFDEVAKKEPRRRFPFSR